MLMGRARAMLIKAGIDSKGKEEFWCEVIFHSNKVGQHNGEARQNKASIHLILQ